MENLKTTFAGFVTAAAALLAASGIVIDPKYTTILLAIGAAVIGFFAKDSSNA